MQFRIFDEESSGYASHNHWYGQAECANRAARWSETQRWPKGEIVDMSEIWSGTGGFFQELEIGAEVWIPA